jgi:hypothetical protein
MRMREAMLSCSKDKTRLRMVQKRVLKATFSFSKDKIQLKRESKATLSSCQDKT